MSVRTPCIGVCSTTSLGDKICRGCKRYAFEVIHWNSYNEEEKEAVMKRIILLTEQIMSSRFRIFSTIRLEQAMNDFHFIYDPSLTPYCWLHGLLQKYLYRITSLREIGVELMPDYREQDSKELLHEVNTELLVLGEAHFERYFMRV